MIKNRTVKNIEDGIKQVNKMYLHRGFKITHIHADCEFEQLWQEIVDLRIYLNLLSKKEHALNI